MADRPLWTEQQLHALIAMAEVLGYTEDIKFYTKQLAYYKKKDKK